MKNNVVFYLRTALKMTLYDSILNICYIYHSAVCCWKQHSACLLILMPVIVAGFCDVSVRWSCLLSTCREELQEAQWEAAKANLVPCVCVSVERGVTRGTVGGCQG